MVIRKKTLLLNVIKVNVQMLTNLGANLLRHFRASNIDTTSQRMERGLPARQILHIQRLLVIITKFTSLT